ncbi:MAG: amidohydrolase family protein [Spirochaetia bacterium]|jgi:cytosine deaminase|nr:amidohydrolase family protein [Spirochaetia bacterium]
MTIDILIKNALLRNSTGTTTDIAISGGKVTEIRKGISDQANETIDAKGNLVTESFVNGHLHLDKVYTLEKVGMDAMNSYKSGSMGGAMTSIEQASKVKEEYDEKWIIENVRTALDLAVKFGNTHIRAFADTDTKAKLEGIKAVLKAKEEYKDRVDVQVVAFPQDGIAKDPGAEEYIRQAMELGADVVGGIPWIEYTEEEMQDHIDKMFALAVEFNKDVSMLLDDAGDPDLRTTEMLIKKTLKEGWEGRVTIQHARAMSMYSEVYYRKIEHLLKKARIGLVSDPQTGPLHARVRDLYNAGVSVALGQDDISDAYYPFGRNNMLEVAFISAHIMGMTTFDEIDILYDLITTNAAKALGIKNFELAVGNEANIVVLGVPSTVKALWSHEAPVAVIKAGKNITVK